MITRTIAVGAETVQIRTLSWNEFWRIRPDRKHANDNEPAKSLDANALHWHSTVEASNRTGRRCLPAPLEEPLYGSSITGCSKHHNYAQIPARCTLGIKPEGASDMRLAHCVFQPGVSPQIFRHKKEAVEYMRLQRLQHPDLRTDEEIIRDWRRRSNCHYWVEMRPI